MWGPNGLRTQRAKNQRGRWGLAGCVKGPTGSPLVKSEAREVGRHRCPNTARWQRATEEV